MLKSHVLAIIIRRWEQGERAITCENICADLLQLGICVSEDMLARALGKLKASKLVDIPQPRIRHAQKIHSRLIVTWVSSTLLSQGE